MKTIRKWWRERRQQRAERRFWRNVWGQLRPCWALLGDIRLHIRAAGGLLLVIISTAMMDRFPQLGLVGLVIGFALILSWPIAHNRQVDRYMSELLATGVGQPEDASPYNLSLDLDNNLILYCSAGRQVVVPGTVDNIRRLEQLLPRMKQMTADSVRRLKQIQSRMRKQTIARQVWYQRKIGWWLKPTAAAIGTWLESAWSNGAVRRWVSAWAEARQAKHAKRLECNRQNLEAALSGLMVAEQQDLSFTKPRDVREAEAERGLSRLTEESEQPLQAGHSA